MVCLIRDALLFVVLSISIIFDLKYRRIPNYLLVGALVVAVLLNVYIYSCKGLLVCVAGLAAGIGLLIIPFALRGIGAGDVKLLGVIGAFMGVGFVLNAFLYAAIWGGVISIAILLFHRKLPGILKWIGRFLKQVLLIIFYLGKHPLVLDPMPLTKLSLPYAVPIVLGAATVFVIGRLF